MARIEVDENGRHVIKGGFNLQRDADTVKSIQGLVFRKKE